MSQVEVLSTVRIGQLTGSTRVSDPKWEHSVDPMQWPLLNDTGRWGVIGVDLGANTEHSDGRLYFFFGDVAVEWDPNFPGYSGDPQIIKESDLVAWTDDTEVFRHGGHLEFGWNFFLPNDEQGATASTGQPDWRFCGRCGGLFLAPNESTAGSVCPKGGEHRWIGKKFFLPNDHQGATDATGQKDWRFCGKCHGLFWASHSQPAGACPKGDKHEPMDWFFYLPNDQQGATFATGQPDWRFCINCNGLFWAGSAFKGLCPGASLRGGGFHLHAVVQHEGPFKGKFAPLNAQDPIGLTSTYETPSGAFSYNGRVYVFVNVSETKYSGRVRFADPAYGLYLVSNSNPDFTGGMRDDLSFPPTYIKEFLFSPRIGCCPKDANRSLFESHEILDFKFILPQAADGAPADLNNWRFCKKCEAIFWNDGLSGACWKGGRHEADGGVYPLSPGTAEDARHQSNWRRCQDCASLFWDGDSAKKGLCPAGGNHRGMGEALLIPHLSEEEDPHNNGDWRFCLKCHGMVKSNQMDVFPGVAAWVVDNANNDLPEREGKGVVMFTVGYWRGHIADPGFRLAWMPLKSGGPRLQDTLYYTGKPGRERWSDNADEVATLFPHSKFYTSLSAAWLDGPRCWILLYSDATPDSGNIEDFKGPVMARISTQLWDWSEPIEIFRPVDGRDYGSYMHWPGRDPINLDVPPLPPWDPDRPGQREDKPGWAYGAFILNRFTKWDEATRVLEIYYLLSTSRPYQVQLMHSTLRFGNLGVIIPAWLNREEVLNGDDMGLVRPSAEQLGLTVEFEIAQARPGFGHEGVIQITPPAGTIVQPGSTITVLINLEG